MNETTNEQTDKFLKYWEYRFNKILEQNTNWTKLILSVDQDSLPQLINIDKFCFKYSQDFQLNISYKLDENTNHYDLTITK